MLSGINHITFLTDDLDRLVLFYDDVFGARKVVELPVPEPEGPGRHALIAVGGSAALHVFELEKQRAPEPAPMFSRGRIDHFALHVADTEAFDRLRSVLIERGVTDGRVTDFGVTRVLSFQDPDGHVVELADWVGGASPLEIDSARATDDELIARRTQTRRP
jgi:catechol 2,3-dioxygenase-like lactoylglutathione lyase family enzyme